VLQVAKLIQIASVVRALAVLTTNNMVHGDLKAEQVRDPFPLLRPHHGQQMGCMLLSYGYAQPGHSCHIALHGFHRFASTVRVAPAVCPGRA
jgi:hypothetical protein